MWLADVRRLQAEMEAEKQAKEADRREKEERLKASQRVQQLKQFTLSLRSVLGKQAADDLLGGPDAQATELEVESAPYWLVFEPPQGIGQGIQYRLTVKRYLPEEVALFLHGHSKAPISFTQVKTLAELAKAIATIDESYAKKMSDYGPQKRQAELEGAAPTDETPAAPGDEDELPTFNRSTAEYLETLAEAMRMDTSLDELDTWDALVIALAQHLMVEHQ